MKACRLLKTRNNNSLARIIISSRQTVGGSKKDSSHIIANFKGKRLKIDIFNK